MEIKNVDLYLKNIGIEQKDLADKLNINPNTVGHWKRVGKIPSKYIPQLEKILMESQRNVRSNEVVDSGAVVSTPFAQSEFKPVIPTELYGKLDCDIDEYVHNNIASVRRSPIIRQFAPFSYFFEVMGDAMLPDFRPADMLALKILPHPWKIEGGRVYVIDTKGGILVRMLYRIDGENFMARALNPRFTELPIPSSDVYDIYMVVGLVRRNI